MLDLFFQAPARILLGPGPSQVYPQVLKALAQPTIGHLDPEFLKMMDEVRMLLKYVMQTQNVLTFVVPAPASAAMESAIVNVVEPEEKVIVCVNGVFGQRMLENVKRCGGIPIVVEDPWGSAIDLDKVTDAFKKHKDIKAICAVHAETSTGVLSDVEGIAHIARSYDALSIIDAVTSVAGVPFKMDAWGIDVAYTGSQKCLSCIPGLAPMSFSDRAIALLKKRKKQVQSWFLDVNLIMEYWLGDDNKKRAYHHTAPVNSLYALHAALVIAKQVGLEQLWVQHRVLQQKLTTALKEINLPVLIAEKNWLAPITVVKIPESIDDHQFRNTLLKEHQIEIGGGLGIFAGRVWRIGMMGYLCREDSVTHLINALKHVLSLKEIKK